jgi:hypothetical protein
MESYGHTAILRNAVKWSPQGVTVKSEKHDSYVCFSENQPIFVRFSKISENAREFLKLFLLKLFENF